MNTHPTVQHTKTAKGHDQITFSGFGRTLIGIASRHDDRLGEPVDKITLAFNDDHSRATVYYYTPDGTKHAYEDQVVVAKQNGQLIISEANPVPKFSQKDLPKQPEISADYNDVIAYRQRMKAALKSPSVSLPSAPLTSLTFSQDFAAITVTDAFDTEHPWHITRNAQSAYDVQQKQPIKLVKIIEKPAKIAQKEPSHTEESAHEKAEKPSLIGALNSDLWQWTKKLPGRAGAAIAAGAQSTKDKAVDLYENPSQITDGASWAYNGVMDRTIRSIRRAAGTDGASIRGTKNPPNPPNKQAAQSPPATQQPAKSSFFERAKKQCDETFTGGQKLAGEECSTAETVAYLIRNSGTISREGLQK